MTVTEGFSQQAIGAASIAGDAIHAIQKQLEFNLELIERLNDADPELLDDLGKAIERLKSARTSLILAGSR
jgi:hypothetical protein